MKKILFFIAMIFMVNHLFSQVPSDCTIPSILMSEYEIDVIDLAYRRMYEINSPDTIHIDIPSIYQDTIWHGLSAIFNAFSINERDSIFDIYCVHRHPSYFMISYFITVKIDTTYSWTNAWLNLNTTTGYTELDNLLANYGFSISNVNSLNFADLFTDQIINVKALCDSLEKFVGIDLAEPAGYGGDGDCISYNKIGNEQFYDFSIGWGDCWLGCINRYFWHFKVNYTECSVEYLGNEADLYDSIFPDPVNCDITYINPLLYTNTMDIKLYPNPTYGKFTIETANIQRIDIFNIYGKCLKKIKDKSQNIKVDLSKQPKGVYFLKVTTNKGTAVEKVVLY